MDTRQKRRLTYVATAIFGALVVILAVLLLQQPIPTSTVPNNPAPTTTLPPGVVTNAATGIDRSNATLNGDLTSLGSASSVTFGFVYGTSASLTGAVNVSTGARTAPGGVSSTLTGLSTNTTYYFRAWASGAGFVAGKALTFSTLPPATPPPSGGGSGNGHQVPPGWAHAACPNVPDDAPAHGLRARCEHSETWGQMKKESQTDATAAPVHDSTLAQGSAEARTSAPGHSRGHRSDNARSW